MTGLRWTPEQLREWQVKQAKPGNKYAAQKRESDGLKFDSKAEEKRYYELKILERTGVISELEVHPIYPLMGGGFRLTGRRGLTSKNRTRVYTADFRYLNNETGFEIIEDVKGLITTDADLRIAIFEMFYDTPVHIIGGK